MSGYYADEIICMVEADELVRSYSLCKGEENF